MGCWPSLLGSRSRLFSLMLLALLWANSSPAKETDMDMPLTSVTSSVQPDLFTGAATASIPIDVPPGRHGMQPNLHLSYWSGSGNGWIGEGWKLELGAIERRTRFGVNYTGDEFTFRLSGISADLVNIGNDEYRAKIEGSFTRVRKLTATDGQPYWEATDKKGTRYLFGQTAASRMADPANAGRIFKWCLDWVVDPNGNYMKMVYAGDQGQGYLDRIDYTGYTTNGLESGSTIAPTHTVKFYRETRSDAPDLYVTQYRIKTASRLKTMMCWPMAIESAPINCPMHPTPTPSGVCWQMSSSSVKLPP